MLVDGRGWSVRARDGSAERADTIRFCSCCSFKCTIVVINFALESSIIFLSVIHVVDGDRGGSHGSEQSRPLQVKSVGIVYLGDVTAGLVDEGARVRPHIPPLGLD